MEQLLKSISELKTEYDNRREKDRFNIISIFHKEREEKLHSRVISYLLSPSSGHGMTNTYCSLFIKNVLKISDAEFNLSNFEVFPNEYEKSEYKFIDILIINKSRSQAIIIENKIDARDSNHTHKLNLDNNIGITNFDCKKAKTGYIGQLERYYNTIKTGIDKDGIACPETQCYNVFVYYLSPNGKQPDSESVGMLKDIPESWNDNSIISYDYSIREWLKECIENTPSEKTFVKEFIQHYLKIVNKMTHNDIPLDERISLKNIIGNNIQHSKYLIDNFKHVKWHTVYEFWEVLIDQLKISGYKNIEAFPNDGIYKELNNPLFTKTITEVAHLNKLNLNYGVLFDLKNGHRAYISSLGRLSWGNQHLNKWSYFEINVDFSDFSLENTYGLIDIKNMSFAIEIIISEISYSESIDYNNLIPIQ